MAGHRNPGLWRGGYCQATGTKRPITFRDRALSPRPPTSLTSRSRSGAAPGWLIAAVRWKRPGLQRPEVSGAGFGWRNRGTWEGGPAMTQEETDAADVTLDLLAIQSSALEAMRDCSRYLRNAENAGLPEVAYFVRQLMEEDSARAAHCQGLLRKLSSTGAVRPASRPAEHGQ